MKTASNLDLRREVLIHWEKDASDRLWSEAKGTLIIQIIKLVWCRII